MAMKKGIWDTILKVIIAVASAVLGALAEVRCKRTTKLSQTSTMPLLPSGSMA